ncbi:transcription factor LEC1 [Cinnamomum micranthum f. kanehirae]|uniref:Transcription factor LEC1 n=1 Tax=Cinnamomum micranthum f. kanehirae TaxID=337451 RepID=A0A3S3NNM2_9MAGN|nr:transcription factor LEC1 [Cinnamomum micranthum f. kanehirae]
MERGGAFHGYQRFQKPNSGMMSVELNTPQNQTQNQNQTQYGGGGELDSNPDRDGACTVREQDRFMPIANVIRIMRKVLPTHAKISDDAKETIQECVSEYISFITSEANDKCQREQRKTITAEDVLWAMSKLGFDDYIEPLTAYLHRYRELEGDHRGSLRGEPLPKRAVEVGPVAAMAYGPAAFHMGLHHQGLFGGGMGAYFRDGSGVNPSQSAMAGYDPFAAYK